MNDYSSILNLFVFQFDGRKLGDIVISISFRDELEQKFGDLRFTLHKLIDLLENRVKFYRSTMEKSIVDHKSYFSNDELKELHQKLKNEILVQIQMQTDADDYPLIVCICT